MVSADNPYAGKSKTEIRDMQIAITEAEIAKFDSLPQDTEYKSSHFDLTGRKGMYGTSAYVVTKGFVKGLTLEAHANFRGNIADTIKKLNSEITYHKLDDIEGCAMAYRQHIKMPMFITNRSILNVFHLIENDDGGITFFNTS